LSPGIGSSTRAAPVIRVAPPRRSSAICASLGVVREQERERRFRPDQMGHVGDAGRSRRGRPVRQRQIAPYDRVPVLGPETRILRDVGLHDAQFHARDQRRVRGRKAIAAEAGQQGHGHERRQSRPRPRPPARFVGQSRWRGENGDREQRKSVQPDHRCDLAEDEILAERHAEVVPGKPGQRDRAQPFARAEAGGEREYPRRARRPQEAGEGEADCGKQRQPRGQGEDAERKRPRELVGLDEKGGAEPPQAGDEITEAPPPTRAEGRAHRSNGRASARAGGG